MGIAGFFLWLQRWYEDCIDPVNGESTTPIYDNLYLDMNGLIHPCCHDTAPLPEPKSEEEMLIRVYQQIDLLVKTVKPRKCLIMAIDGVAPRSKMNQQRSRRFKAIKERKESNQLMAECAQRIAEKFNIPYPKFQEKWDHNVITPSTDFMERMGQAIEWYILKKINEDPLWQHLTVVFSDAHVPGEGEHKIMEYIRALRAQEGYDPNTTHCIHGMDADLICLGLVTHEPNFGILRNTLDENFQQEKDKFCYFNLAKFRRRLCEDFSAIKNADFERIVDDFVFLCFFAGNDFLPHLPLIAIKTKGIECLLDHYTRSFSNHGYLTDCGEINFEQLRVFLSSFIVSKFEELKKQYIRSLTGKAKARSRVTEAVAAAKERARIASESLKSDKSNAAEVGLALLRCLTKIEKEQRCYVAFKSPLLIDYTNYESSRNDYYEQKFGWDRNAKDFEVKISTLCGEYFRGVQWVMRYYTKGCPSWDWYYPYHYGPLIQDLAKATISVNVKMKLSAPLHPVEQLLCVLPRESVLGLPEEIREAVSDKKSVLSPFYPNDFKVDATEATFDYQAIPLLPFLNVNELKAACRTLVDLEPDCGTAVIFVRISTPICTQLKALVKNGAHKISAAVTALAPIAGKVSKYRYAPRKGQDIECPDGGVIAIGGKYGKPIKKCAVTAFAYEIPSIEKYNNQLLQNATDHLADVPVIIKQQQKDGELKTKKANRKRKRTD